VCVCVCVCVCVWLGGCKCVCVSEKAPSCKHLMPSKQLNHAKIEYLVPAVNSQVFSASSTQSSCECQQTLPLVDSCWAIRVLMVLIYSQLFLPFRLGPHRGRDHVVFFFFSTLITGPGRSLSLKLSDARVYAPVVRRAVPWSRQRVHVVSSSSSSLLLASLELSDPKVYEPEIRARLGTAAHFCKVVACCLEVQNSHGLIARPDILRVKPHAQQPT